MITLIAFAVGLAGGFGIGRIKNANKLKAVSAELAKVENSAVAEVKTLVADIKAKL